MILVGQYDSPFVRRVAISLRVLNLPYEQDVHSVFGDFDWMRTVNPLGRIPSLRLDSGEVLIDSAAILDWIDEQVGAERALIPRSGEARRRMMQVIALAAGAIEKFGAVNYEQIIRPPQYRWPAWIERCRTQGLGALAALEALEWRAGGRTDQAEITTACLVAYVKMTNPDVMPARAFPNLEALAARCEARPEFAATRASEYAVPRG